MGGAALHFGWVAEMKTGEGKTLVSTLPAYLNGVAGQGMHIITVNDYLATPRRRVDGSDPPLARPDGRPDHPRRLRQRVQARAVRLRHHLRHEQRVRLRLPPRQHGDDEGAEDPARPRVRHRRRGRLDPHRRGPHAADHQRPCRRRGEALLQVRQRSSAACAATRTTRSTRRSASSRRSSPASRRSRPRSASRTSTTASPRTSSTSSSAALKAKELYKRDKDYIIQHGEVKIVDEFTGRILEGRRWSEGLHQAVEAKEGVKIKEENQTLATITLQNYFRMYEKLAGMTGTAQTEASELANTYNLQVVPIPTQPADGPRRPGRPHLQDRGRQVRRRRRRPRRALRDRPAGARRHDLGREVREAQPPAREARHRARGAERQAAHA